MKDNNAPEQCVATSADSGAVLRQLEEEIISDDAQDSCENLPLLTPEAMQQALPELRVPQIGLEMQHKGLDARVPARRA